MTKGKIIHSGKTDPIEVCAHAASRRLKAVLVIGIEKDGTPYYAGSTSSVRTIKTMTADFLSGLGL